jgi:hypothetical protein
VHDAILNISGGTQTGEIRTRNLWVSPDGNIVCTDTRAISFHKIVTGRAIDYEVTIHASEGDVTFGDTKEGAMAIRTHPALRLSNDPAQGVTSANGRALNSEGYRDGDLWGRRAAWVDYWGNIDTWTVGIAVFDHPQNPRHPTWWHARTYGLIAANAFGIHDFEGRPSGTGDMLIPSGKSNTFRYRYIFHEGDATKARISESYRQYVDEKSSAIFRRGDFQADGAIDIFDAVNTLEWLFLGEGAPGCIAVMNTNGDKAVDISDPISLLEFLFLEGPQPVAPFPDCGTSNLEADRQFGCQTPPGSCRQ